MLENPPLLMYVCTCVCVCVCVCACVHVCNVCACVNICCIGRDDVKRVCDTSTVELNTVVLNTVCMCVCV